MYCRIEEGGGGGAASLFVCSALFRASIEQCTHCCSAVLSVTCGKL